MLLIAGCARTPRIYTMQPEALESIRSEISTVGVYISPEPLTDTFVEVHVELIRLKDDTILIDEHFTCASDQERTYKDWADQAGSDVIFEFRDCVPELTEKIIDDLFMVYPVN